MKIKVLLSALILILTISPVVTQEGYNTRSGFYSAGLLQIKESANRGVVFSGPAVNYGRRIVNCHERFTSIYEFEIGLATPFTRDILGVNFHFKPVDLFLGYNLPAGEMEFNIGPTFRLNYNVQFYPDLQSGYDFWLTELSLGLAVRATIPVGESIIEVKAINSLSGVVCRNDIEYDPYFFDLNFFHILRDIHQNGRTFNPGNFNSSSLEILFHPAKLSGISFAVCADYTLYGSNPEISMLNQSIKLFINPLNK